MRSVASFKSHPIHPMLVAFPIAFLTGALVCDWAGVLLDRPRWWAGGAYLALAGIASAFVAAVPGFIDYLYTVPPDSSGKKRATQHMIVNLGAVALFIVAWVLRGDADARPGWGTLLLELAGMGLMTTGGWLGGTLVYRNLIGPDHRYADAGKWKEQSVEARPREPIDAAATDELEVGQMKLLRVGDRRIALARTAGGYCAFADRCSHRGGSLAGGVLIGDTVQCLWHGSQFDVESGQVRCGPAEHPIQTYRVDENAGRVRVILDADANAKRT
jgi:uncharacterized membrane protein/nitrite reductase/ring-hydroxylating ferredoxin subunit